MFSVLALARVGEEMSTTYPPLSTLIERVDTQKPLIPLREIHLCPPCPPYNHKRDISSNTVGYRKSVNWVVWVDTWTNDLFLNVLKYLLSVHLSGRVDTVDTPSLPTGTGNWHNEDQYQHRY